MGLQSKIIALKREIFISGQVPPVTMDNNLQPPLVSKFIFDSWQRSFDSGVEINGPVDDSFLLNDQLSDVLDINRSLIDLVQPEMAKLFQLTKGDENVIILADHSGVILNQIGDATFLKKSAHILLTQGANWAENNKGTNAIGTAIKQDQAVCIHGGEHYLDINGFLTCAAVPIHSPYGDILGVLDITGDYRSGNKHSLALLNMSVEHIENEMFNHRFHQDIIVELYPNNHQNNWFEKTILVFDYDGVLIAANKVAMRLFGVSKQSLSHFRFSTMFDNNIRNLLDHIMLSNNQKFQLSTHNGAIFYARAKSSYARLRSFANMPKTISKAKTSIASAQKKQDIEFGLIDLGDPLIATSIKKLKKLSGHDIPILLIGETGTGKEWMAKAIHQNSERCNMPFVAINCASIPNALIEAELFGYVGGAFTGASANGQLGKIMAANGGFLFLDEIGDMPIDLQSRLLRVLEERELCPIGSTQNLTFDIRLIAASNINLMQAVADGKFRQDLYYRLNGLALTLPPLAERTDMRKLTAAILKREFLGRDIGLSEAVWKCFEAFDWPGNLRQLRHVLKISGLICDGDIIDLSCLPDDIVNAQSKAPKNIEKLLKLSDGERIVIVNMLKSCNNNLSKTARNLGISRNTLYSKIKEFGLKY